MIQLSLILKKLNQKNLQILNPSENAYIAVIRNEKICDLHNDRIINLVTAEEWDKASCKNISGALFIIGSPLHLPDGQETVLFPAKALPEQLLNEVQNIISEHQRFLEYKIRLETLAGHATNIYDIFKLFSSYYNNPVVFGDSGGNIIYMENLRKDFHDYDEAINYWLTLGYTPYEYSKANGNIEMTSIWQNSPVPVLFNKKFASRYPRLSYRTCKYDQVYNNYFCIVQVYEPYKAFDEDALVLTADLVSSYYSKNAFSEIENPREKAFKFLVHQETSQNATNADRLKRYHITDNSQNCLVILDFKKHPDICQNQKKTSAEKWAYVRNMLNHMQPSILNFIEEDILVLLLQATTPDGIDALEKKLRNILEDNIVMASSCTYNNIWKTHDMYQKALLVLKAGELFLPDSNLHRFKDLYFEILCYIMHQEHTLSAFIIDGLAELTEYDRRKHTDFAATLYEYLLCDKNISVLSQKLHIHRNTALYRLEKANERLQIDLNDFQSTARLFLSYKALEFLDKIKKQQDL